MREDANIDMKGTAPISLPTANVGLARVVIGKPEYGCPGRSLLSFRQRRETAFTIETG